MTSGREGQNQNEVVHHYHSSIVLFYKYFIPRDYPFFHQHADSFYVERLIQFQKDLCSRLNLKGRVLLATEGVNGTLSATSVNVLREYISVIEQFEVVRDLGLPPKTPNVPKNYEEEYLFRNIDWKLSSRSNDTVCSKNSEEKKEETSKQNYTKDTMLEPFPDLKISMVKEIISSGGALSVDEIPDYGGNHLDPKEFHQALVDNPDAVVIDVRNTFEHDIGHFVHPLTQQAAINPEMVTFSSFDSQFCAKNAETFKDKKVLMYCTGGIRCEKASAMLKKRGVKDVSQLKGGIHRYLEEYGSQGCFQGLNFVFDQRVAQKPSECKLSSASTSSCTTTSSSTSSENIVGRCIECACPFDEISGSRLCTVCRDLVLICPKCQENLREYHCHRHAEWKHCYFTFLEVFDDAELEIQRSTLQNLRDTVYLPAAQHKNVRKTISRQMEKLTKRIDDLSTGTATVDRNAPRHCRTCMEPSTICDGCCWGFWKSARETKTNSAAPILPIAVGDKVQPGRNWNEIRMGSIMDKNGSRRQGTVVEVKSWGAGCDDLDCVTVQWDDDKKCTIKPYRWGVFALDGKRMYDLEKIE